VEFPAEAAFNAATTAADGMTTVRDTKRGQHELSFPEGSAQLIGKYPTAESYSRAMVPLAVVEGLVGHKLEESDKKALRMLGHAIILGGGAAHAGAFIHNEVTPPPSKKGK
jgi:hypothetical protein